MAFGGSQKKSSLPVSLSTIFAAVVIVNGIWLVLNMLQYPVPLGYETNVQKMSVWFAAIASILGGLHMITVRLRHRAVRSLL